MCPLAQRRGLQIRSLWWTATAVRLQEKKVAQEKSWAPDRWIKLVTLNSKLRETRNQLSTAQTNSKRKKKIRHCLSCQNLRKLRTKRRMIRTRSPPNTKWSRTYLIIKLWDMRKTLLLSGTRLPPIEGSWTLPRDIEKASECWLPRTAGSTKESGSPTKGMVRATKLIRPVTSTKEHSWTTSHTGKVIILGTMENLTTVNGSKAAKTGSVSGKASSMTRTWVSGVTTKSGDTEYISGQTATSTRESGRGRSRMVKVQTTSQTKTSTPGSIWTANPMVTASTNGSPELNT